MAPASSLSRAPRPSSLADVLDLILDKGLVIDAYVRVSAVGIEILTIDARIVVASVDTYLRFAEAVNRLDLTQTETAGMPELMHDMRGDGNGRSNGSHNGSRNGGARELAAGRRSLAGGQQREREGANPRPRRNRDDAGEPEGDQESDGLLGRLAGRGRWS